MKFRKKAVYIEAWQWFRHGDVPEVGMIPFSQKVNDAKRAKLGWLDTPEGGHCVFPGDWVIIDSKGRLSTCNPMTFKRLYEVAETRILPVPGELGKSA